MPERIFTFITICVTNIPPHSVFPVGTVTESRSLSEKAIMTFHSNLQNTFFACKSKFGTNCQKNEWKFGILLNNGREAKKKKKEARFESFAVWTRQRKRHVLENYSSDCHMVRLRYTKLTYLSSYLTREYKPTRRPII